MKFSYTKNLESEFIKNQNLTKKNSGGGVARVSDFFSFFFFKRIQV